MKSSEGKTSSKCVQWEMKMLLFIRITLGPIRKHQYLTEAGLGVGVDVLVFAPLNHALQNGHQTLEALLSERQLLTEETEKCH